MLAICIEFNFSNAKLVHAKVVFCWYTTDQSNNFSWICKWKIALPKDTIFCRIHDYFYLTLICRINVVSNHYYVKLPFRQKIEVNHRLLEGFIVLKLESTKCECRSFAFLLKHSWKQNFWQQFSSSAKNYYVACLSRVSYTILPLNTSKQNYMLGKIWVLSKPLTFVNRNIFCDSFF